MFSYFYSHFTYQGDIYEVKLTQVEALWDSVPRRHKLQPHLGSPKYKQYPEKQRKNIERSEQ